MMGIHDIGWAFTGAMIMLLLDMGIREIFEKGLWAGEAFLFFAALVGWTIAVILDGYSERCAQEGTGLDGR